MKTKTLNLLVLLPIIISGCVSVPSSVDFNGRDVPAIGPLGAGCKKPYVLTQDCSGFSGATRKIRFHDNIVRIAGSEDGTTFMVMADSALSFKTFELTVTSSNLEKHLLDLGFELIETKAMAVNDDIAGLFFVFDGDVYTVLKEFTVE